MSTTKNAENIDCNAVRMKRLELGLSQAELAKRVGCNQSTITRLEKGQVKDARLIKDVKNALGIYDAPVIKYPMGAPGPMQVMEPMQAKQWTWGRFHSARLSDLSEFDSGEILARAKRSFENILNSKGRIQVTDFVNLCECLEEVTFRAEQERKNKRRAET